MTREEAQEYAKTMSYKQAVFNCMHSKGIAYRKASLIKLRELAEIADNIVDLTNGNTITKAEYDGEPSVSANGLTADQELQMWKGAQKLKDRIFDLEEELLKYKSAARPITSGCIADDIEVPPYTTTSAVSAGRPSGEWEVCKDEDGVYGICSVCGNDADFSHYGKPYAYCPNCGTYMGEVKGK